MRIENSKEWTVLIYANGINELEPDIWKSKIDAEKSGSGENVNASDSCMSMTSETHGSTRLSSKSGYRKMQPLH